jgi:cytochrome P450
LFVRLCGDSKNPELEISRASEIWTTLVRLSRKHWKRTKAKTNIVCSIGRQSMRTEIRGYDAVRNAAKDYQTYSSDLLGDRDVRTYRQLPLEADPPRHTNFRQAVQPLFMGEAISKHKDAFGNHARSLIAGLAARGGGEIASEFALPYVIGCLTIIYNRPQDYDEWLSWGPDVWTAEVHRKGTLSQQSEEAHRERNFELKSDRDGRVLQEYLDRIFDAAEATPNIDPDTQDVWDFVSQIRIEGQRITREEMQGIANVLLAGGRDTVIKLVTGLIWHLIQTPEDRDFLASNRDWFNRTIAEMVRYLSPLPKMERVLAEDISVPDAQRDTSKYVLLNFVSANYDRDVWPDPDVVDIRRERKPHLAFGLGRHSCMGMNITEHEVSALLSVLLDSWPNWTFDGDPEISWAEDQDKHGNAIRYIDRFKELRVRF